MTLSRLRDDPRVTVRSGDLPSASGRCVVYWMQRAQRADDNPALDVAIHAANALSQPVVAFLGLVPFYPRGNLRHYRFLVEGLPSLADRLKARGVPLILSPFPNHSLLAFCEKVRPSLVVGDENPLNETERWRTIVAEKLRAPLWTVDADVIVPTRLLKKEQYAARTIRPRIHALLDQFLIRTREPRAHFPFRVPRGLPQIDPRDPRILDDRFPIDRSVSPVATFRGGADSGEAILKRFLRERLAGYDRNRNHPEQNLTSQLSPWLHFGQLGPRKVALAVLASDGPQIDQEAFLEQLIVRRELAVNFVRYNPRYESLAACEPWALRTLRAHARDRRAYRLSERQLENAESPDPLWNAAQRQMVDEGWMHGYLRMYWAKKILDWSPDAPTALAIAIHLNDKYELDGRDPNGYAGIAWAIGGKHDRAFGERPIYGKVRYMSFESTRMKFDSKRYIADHQRR
jgi:deoxyribodipyrimidine photo-lyase